MSGRPKRERSKIQLRTRPTALGGPEGSVVRQPYSVSRPTMRFISALKLQQSASEAKGVRRPIRDSADSGARVRKFNLSARVRRIFFARALDNSVVDQLPLAAR